METWNCGNYLPIRAEKVTPNLARHIIVNKQKTQITITVLDERPFVLSKVTFYIYPLDLHFQP